jgi:CRISPR-associated endoribonuclease Cas6
LRDPLGARLFINNSKQIIIGTLWEFMFEGWGNKKLIEFALDVGLGERNPLGFGFYKFDMLEILV